MDGEEMSDDVTKGLELAYALRDTTGLSKGTDAAEALRAHLQSMADKAETYRLADLAMQDQYGKLHAECDELRIKAAGAGVPAGWRLTERQISVMRFALLQFATSARHQAGLAAQDKESRIWTQPAKAVESFLRDANDAEELRDLLAAPAAPQPSTTEESSAPEPAAPSEQQDADKLIAMGCAVDRSQAKRLLTQLRAAVNGSSAYEPAQPTELERQMREALEPFARLDLGARLGEIVHQEFGWDVLRARKAIAAFKAAHPAYAEDAQ